MEHVTKAITVEFKDGETYICTDKNVDKYEILLKWMHEFISKKPFTHNVIPLTYEDSLGEKDIIIEKSIIKDIRPYTPGDQDIINLWN